MELNLVQADHRIHARSIKNARCGVFFLIIFAVLLPGNASRASDVRRHVLILSGYNYTLPAATQVIDGMQERLREFSPQVVFDAEFLDLVKAADDPDYELRTAAYLREKYARSPPHLVVAAGARSLQFITNYRDIVSPQIPIVFTAVSPATYSGAFPPPGMTGIIAELDLEKTVELAERLQPQARRMFLIAGSSPLEDRQWQETARRALEGRARKFETTYLFGLSHETLVAEVSRIPKDAIVIFLTFFVDATGRTFFGRDIAKELASISPAPVYGPYDSYIGHGVVGGFVETFGSLGAATADLALEILGGQDPTTIPARTSLEQAFRVDARAMDRFGLKQSNLPPGSVVLFREPSLWEQHRSLVSATGLIVASLSAFVAILLVQLRRRRQAENSLKESEDRMTFTAASANVGLWQYDRTTDKMWATEHCRAMLGLASDTSFTREAFLAAVHPEDRNVAVGRLQAILRGGESIGTDIRILHPDGQVRWVRARAHANGQGTPGKLSGMLADITAQKAAESEAELRRQEVTHLTRVAVLGELSGAIAHEVNQPLTAIRSNTQAALYLLAPNSPNYAEIRDALEDVVRENSRAADVIQRLRGLLKKGETKRELLDINQIVISTLTLLRRELVDRGITADTDLASDLQAVWGDSVQLQQVLLNLIMNAMDAMASTPLANRQIKICTSARGEIVEVTVKDRGPGIRSTDEKQPFEPFFTTKEHGLGLGLSICLTIAQQHGGTIDLRNDADGGAVAKVYLSTQN